MARSLDSYNYFPSINGSNKTGLVSGVAFFSAGMEQKHFKDASSRSVLRASNASSSIHLAERTANSKRQANALQSPPVQNSFIDGRRWLRPPPPPDVAAPCGGDKIAASCCSVAAAPKMAAPCHLSAMAGRPFRQSHFLLLPHTIG
ncbi:unnamed protein product [Lampetra planeri]